jgi:hypothetical protein
LGIFIFELLYDTMPFKRATTMRWRCQHCVACTLEFPKDSSISLAAKEPAHRLGAAVVKQHPFFNSDVNWAMLLRCVTQPRRRAKEAARGPT